MNQSELIKLKKLKTSDLWINLHTTDYCNLNCSYCYYKNKDQKTPSYDIGKIIEFVKNVNKPLGICFYGGEPTLNIKYIAEVISKVKKINKNVYFSIQTNGLLLDKIPSLILNEFYMISLSIDGKKEVTDKVRGKGVYNKIISNIKEIRQKGYKNPIMARMTLTENNNFYEDVIDLMNNFDYIYWQLDNDLGSRDNIKFQEKYLEDIKKLLYHLIEKKDFGKNKVLIPFFGIYVLLKTCEKDFDSYYHCVPGNGSVTIDCKGNIFSCPESVSRANNNSDSYIGKVNNKNNFFIEPHKNKEICNSCDVKYVCGGRCIWTHETFYCDCSKAIINLIKNHEKEVDKIVNYEKIYEILDVIFSTEIMP